MTTTETQKTQKQDCYYALQQYHRYGRGRSMKQFCEDEGYDYAKFSEYSRKGNKELSVLKEKASGFIPLEVEGTQPQVPSITELNASFSNGLELNLRDGSVERTLT